MTLICAITEKAVWIPDAWTAWRIGSLHFRKRPAPTAGFMQIEWRESGSFTWKPLPAVERARERVTPIRNRRAS